MSHVVAKRYRRPLAYETISIPPSFDSPYSRSTNDIGTCDEGEKWVYILGGLEWERERGMREGRERRERKRGGRNSYFSKSVATLSSSDNHLHLEDVSFRYAS